MASRGQPVWRLRAKGETRRRPPGRSTMLPFRRAVARILSLMSGRWRTLRPSAERHQFRDTHRLAVHWYGQLSSQPVSAVGAYQPA